MEYSHTRHCKSPYGNRIAACEYCKVGDVVGQIDPRPYQAALAQAQAAYQKDLAQLRNATIDEARAKKLIATGSRTTQASETASSQVAIMEATAAGEQAAAESAKLNLDFATVTAPISGRAGLRETEARAIVHTNDPLGIVTITQMHPIAVQFSLPQDELPDLVARQTMGSLTVPVDSRDRVRHLCHEYIVTNSLHSTSAVLKFWRNTR